MKNIKIFILFATILLAAIGYKTYEQYHQLKNTQKLIALNEVRTLSSFISSFRQTYQNIFLKKGVILNENIMDFLPVHTTMEISRRFATSVHGDISIRTVSDRPRDKNNMANDFELKMMNFFKKNPQITHKFMDHEDGYSYTKPLWVKISCIQCHGKRSDAIPWIRDKYQNAYDYKVGDIRGLLSIKIKEQDIFSQLYAEFITTVTITGLLYIILLIIIYILIQKIQKKEERYTKELENKIERKTNEIKKQKDTFEILFEKSADGILILDNGKFVQCNEKIVEMLQYDSKEELLSVDPREFSPRLQPDNYDTYKKSKEMQAYALHYGKHQFECVHKRINGEYFWTEVNLVPIILNNRNVMYVSWRDISERKNVEEKLIEQKNRLYYQANHDVLTDLPNRMFFNQQLQESINQAQNNKTKLALLFIDLDQFKKINDSLGHEIGDQVLKIVAKRLRIKTNKKYFLSRFGGDEFTIIMQDYKNIKNISALTKEIHTFLIEPINIENHMLYISCSIGVSLYPKDSIKAENLLKYADAAMYKAKEEGRNNWKLYDIEMTKLAFERLHIEVGLRQALKNKEFIIHYQAQINGKSEKLIGMEALVRWKHPLMGIISPIKFIEIAKDSGLIIEIDRWVMQNAMIQIKQWYEEGFNPKVLAINLTLGHLKRNDFMPFLKKMMKDIGFKPEWLELEITEGEVMTKEEESITKLREISNMGISVAIDDFGTGYSSLSYLKRLPVNKLKIDRSFIKHVEEDAEDAAIVKAIISLAHILNLDIIAEGVETIEQKEFLIKNSCPKLQGYYFAKPMSAKKLKANFLDTPQSFY